MVKNVVRNVKPTQEEYPDRLFLFTYNPRKQIQSLYGFLPVVLTKSNHTNVSAISIILFTCDGLLSQFCDGLPSHFYYRAKFKRKR